MDWTSRNGFQAFNVSFMATVTAFFLGMFTFAREIVKELPIYRHERLAGLEVLPYLLSKIIPLTAINAFQALCIVIILKIFTDFSEVGGFFAPLFILFLVSVAGMLMGLAISANTQRTDTPISAMIFAIIPQLLFAGNTAELEGFRKFAASILITTY